MFHDNTYLCTKLSTMYLLCKVDCASPLRLGTIAAFAIGLLDFPNQGCLMACFQTKNPKNLGKFWRVLQWKMLVYFMDTWSILLSFVIFYGHLV
jgi:hypothetical protein